MRDFCESELSIVFQVWIDPVKSTLGLKRGFGEADASRCRPFFSIDPVLCSGGVFDVWVSSHSEREYQAGAKDGLVSLTGFHRIAA